MSMCEIDAHVMLLSRAEWYHPKLGLPRPAKCIQETKTGGNER